MQTREAIKTALAMSDMVWKGYVADLSDADLLVRPVPGINHIAWQLGHLITAEHGMIEGCCPGTMPPLPAGFAERHAKETASSDDAGLFLSKDDYLRAADAQRSGLLAALDRLSDADLDRPTPERFQKFAATTGALMLMQATHWLMHAGQWAVTRRKLGHPPLF